MYYRNLKYRCTLFGSTEVNNLFVISGDLMSKLVSMLIEMCSIVKDSMTLEVSEDGLKVDSTHGLVLMICNGDVIPMDQLPDHHDQKEGTGCH